MPTHTRWENIAYAFAAAFAILLPISYLVMAVWLITVIAPSLESGKKIADPNVLLIAILQVGLYATLIQLPLYILWAACTRQLTFKVRIAWIILLIFGNMMTIPLFLFYIYRGKAQTALTKNIRSESLRKFFEQ